MYGFSFQDIVDGKILTNHVLNAAKQNAVIEFFWEADNPVTMGNARDGDEKPCAALLPGGKGNAVWVSWMDTIVEQLLEYKIGDDHSKSELEPHFQQHHARHVSPNPWPPTAPAPSSPHHTTPYHATRHTTPRHRTRHSPPPRR